MRQDEEYFCKYIQFLDKKWQGNKSSPKNQYEKPLEQLLGCEFLYVYQKFWNTNFHRMHIWKKRKYKISYNICHVKQFSTEVLCIFRIWIFKDINLHKNR